MTECRTELIRTLLPDWTTSMLSLPVVPWMITIPPTTRAVAPAACAGAARAAVAPRAAVVSASAANCRRTRNMVFSWILFTESRTP
ncbi:hypothetical protein ACFQ0B_65490 [Nonomuraea thailandensis]